MPGNPFAVQGALPGATTAAPAPSGGGWLDWARALLQALGAPDTGDNEAVILTWMAGEQPPGSPNAAFNPLNIQAHGYPGEGGITGTSGSGQFDFADWWTGILNTVGFLTQPRYASIVADLRSGAPAAQTLGAIQSSGWASGGYGGGLPGLLASIRANWAQYANGKIAGAGGPSGNLGSGGAPGASGSGQATGLTDSLLAPFFTGVTRVGVLMLGVVGAVGLLILGVMRTTAPVRRQLQERGEQAAGTAATVAKAAAA